MNFKPEITEQDFKACLTAAEQGDSNAMYLIGYCYCWGQGTRTNRKRAVTWWSKAAKQGHVEAQYWLGACYEAGLGVPEDAETALKWLRKSAESGNQSAQIKIVFHYLFPLQRAISALITREEAEKYCNMAAAQGNCFAAMCLSRFKQDKFNT